MSKKNKVLQVTALLSAVSGATLIAGASSSPALSAEIRPVDYRCWDQEPHATSRDYRIHGCVYQEFGLARDHGGSGGPANSTTDNGGGSRPGPGPGPSPGPEPGPTPPDPGPAPYAS